VEDNFAFHKKCARDTKGEVKERFGLCSFCESKEEISKEPKIYERRHTAVSLRVDEESKLLKLRLELGSIGYTIPIKVNYCMFCGEKINA
jgi:hypothetical protein